MHVFHTCYLTRDTANVIFPVLAIQLNGNVVTRSNGEYIRRIIQLGPLEKQVEATTL
jgi:hypothetical protein